jgi:hypothetical protein
MALTIVVLPTPGPPVLAVGAVVDPFAGGGDPLACCDGCGVAYHDVAMPAPWRAAGFIAPCLHEIARKTACS